MKAKIGIVLGDNNYPLVVVDDVVVVVVVVAVVYV